MSDVSFSYFLSLFLFVPFPSRTSSSPPLHPCVLSPISSCLPLSFLIVPVAMGTEADRRRLHRLCRYVIHYLAPSWLAHLDEMGGGRQTWKDRGKRDFTHGTQSKRTAKECGGWHYILTWVIGFSIYVYVHKKGEIHGRRLNLACAQANCPSSSFPPIWHLTPLFLKGQAPS